MSTAKGLLESKKFLAAAIAAGLSFAGIRAGMSAAEVGMIVAPLGVYIGGQAIADFGKERQKVAQDRMYR